MELGLKEKIIMVAAGSKGLGFGIAKAAAQEGARVSIASRSAANVNQALKKLREFTDSHVEGFTFDASNGQSIIDWAEATLDTFGTINGLVVNAGGPPLGKFDQFDDRAWTDAFELTLLSAVRMIRAVLPTMRAEKAGAIVTITSTAVKEPIDTLLLSNVMRSGVTSLVKSLSRDLAPEGIRINNLIPGRMNTERAYAGDVRNAEKKGVSIEQWQAEQQRLIPTGRYGNIDEFGKMGAFLLSQSASYITGATILVDGGLTRTVW